MYGLLDAKIQTLKKEIERFRASSDEVSKLQILIDDQHSSIQTQISNASYFKNNKIQSLQTWKNEKFEKIQIGAKISQRN